jgi:hypothetical protein
MPESSKQIMLCLPGTMLSPAIIERIEAPDGYDLQLVPVSWMTSPSPWEITPCTCTSTRNDGTARSDSGQLDGLGGSAHLTAKPTQMKHERTSDIGVVSVSA